MNDAITIEQELEFLAAQVGTGDIPAIQKLSPAQMAALATGFGRKQNVRIEFGDFSTAATDGRTIALPLTSRENSWIIRGYLDHEIAHVRLTDFDLVPGHSAFRKSTWNILEDIRIEAFMPMLYPGMASNYRALIRELRNTNPGLFEIRHGAPPESIIATYISLMLRSLYLRQVEVADLAIQARQVFIDTFGAQLERDLFTEIMKISDVSTPQDVLDMVERIIRLLEKHAAKQPQDDGDAADRVPDQESGETPGQDPDENQNDTGGQGQTDISQQEVEDNDQPQSTNNSDLEASGDKPQQVSPQTRIQQALDSDEEIGDFGEQLRDLAREKEASGQDQSFDIAAAADKADLLATGYKQQSITAHSGLVARLSSRLRGLLQAQNLQKRHASIHRQPHSQKPPAPHKNRRSKAVSPQGAEKNRKHGHSPARGQLHVHGRERTIPYDKGSHAGPS